MSTNASLVAPARPVEATAGEPLTFERARELAEQAKREFAATDDVLLLKRRISYWANAHDDKLLARFLYTVAVNYASGLTHSTSDFCDPAWESIRDKYAGLYGTRRSVNRLKSDSAPAAEAGTMIVSGQIVDEEEACFTGKHAGARKNNSYAFDFSRAIKTTFTRDPVTGRKIRHDIVVPWDFTQVSSHYSEETGLDYAPESKVDDGLDGGSDDGLDTVQFSPGSPSSTTVLSPGQPGGESRRMVPSGGKEGEKQPLPRPKKSPDTRPVKTPEEVRALIGDSGQAPGPGQDEFCRTYIVRTFSSGKPHCVRLDRDDPSQIKGKPVSVDYYTVSREDDAYMWTQWPKGTPQRPEKHAAWLRMEDDERARVRLGMAPAKPAVGTAESKADAPAPVDGPQEQEERVVYCLVAYDGVSLADLPAELEGVGLARVEQVCSDLSLAGDVAGSSYIGSFRATSEFRERMAGDGYHAAAAEFLADKRRLGIRPGDLAEYYGWREDGAQEVLDDLHAQGTLELSGDRYRPVAAG